jgi:hypothetical protein
MWIASNSGKPHNFKDRWLWPIKVDTKEKPKVEMKKLAG